jgi:lipoprotein-releasing system ATP-binding protein
MSNVIQCTDLKKTYYDAGKPVSVLSGVDFSIGENEMVSIVGASGSGKSTLLHLLGGLDKIDGGDIFWGDQNIEKLSEKRKCKLRNQHLGFVYQFHHLLPEFTALENVAMPLLIRGEAIREIEPIAKDILSAAGLSERIGHKPGQLSGGERQRVAIARALIGRPKCVLADEPTGNLDQKTSEYILGLMLDLQKSYRTSFIIVTHNLTLANKMDKKYNLKNGRLER